MSKDNSNQNSELNNYKQILEQYSVQKQQLNYQKLESENALKELKETDDSFKLVGDILIKKSKEELIKELKDRIEFIDMRVKSIENQEKLIIDKLNNNNNNKVNK